MSGNIYITQENIYILQVALTVHRRVVASQRGKIARRERQYNSNSDADEI